MKKPVNHHYLIAALVLAFSAIPATAATTSFGIKFDARSGQSTMAGHNGLLGAAEWTDLAGASGTGSAALSDGNNIGVTYSSSNVWQSGYGNTYGDGTSTFFAAAAFYSYLDDGSTGVKVSLTGLSAWMTAENLSGYKVTVLRSSDQGRETDANATFKPVKVSYTDGGLILDSIGVQVDRSDVYNGSFDGYAIRQTPYGGMRAMTTSTGVFNNDTLFLTVDTRTGSVRGSLASVIITGIPIPEPSTYAMIGGLASIGLVFIARRRRAK